jgi:hypothetical protein
VVLEAVEVVSVEVLEDMEDLVEAIVAIAADLLFVPNAAIDKGAVAQDQVAVAVVPVKSKVSYI